MSRKAKLIFPSIALCCCFAATASFAQQAVTSQDNRAPRLRGTYTVRVAPNRASATSNANSNAQTLPLFTYNIHSTRDGNEYTGVMVGRNPFNGGSGQERIPTQIIPLIIITHTVGNTIGPDGTITTTPGRTVFDPTIPNNSCLSAPNNVPLKLAEQSPIFEPALFNFGGTTVGNTQYVDAFQRANFWNEINRSSYHTILNTKVLAPIVLEIPAALGLALSTTSLGPPAFCERLGILDIDNFDSIITNQVLPALKEKGVNPSTFPIFLLSNVVESDLVTNLNHCCILGYHGTNGNGPIQTYSPADFESTGLFGTNTLDSAVLSHEVAEWMDDPFGNNPTPPWGHVGQVPGCQNNLEVGDPLSGTDAPRIFMPNGFTYHLQELAFFSWFYATPSIGIHGWFSDNATFLTDAGPPCQSGG